MMTAPNDTTARLIFAGDTPVSLPTVSELVSEALGRRGVHVRDVSLNGLSVSCGSLSVVVGLSVARGETVLSVTLTAGARGAAGRLARLAPLVYALARDLPEVTAVIWAGTELRIPRDAFVAELDYPFGDITAAVTPRRVVRAWPGNRRPLSAGRRPPALPPRRPLPDAVRTRGAPANGRAGLRCNAHVEAYEAHLRATLLREADPEELAQLEAELGPMPVEARLSAWAVSLTVATFSLPIAAPLLVYNIARGEDLRAASLTLGLAGFFLALESSGAMAAIGLS